MAKELLQAALASHMAGDLSHAEALYRSILEGDPEQPDALHFMGILLHQTGVSDTGLEFVKQSLQHAPLRADWHNDLGNLLVERGDLVSAAEAFRNAVLLDSRNAHAWNNLGAVLERQGQTEEAESAYSFAIDLDPLFADALNNMGNLLSAQGKEVEAAHHYCRAYVIEPLEGKPKSMLGVAYYKLGRILDAAEVYRQWMQEEPENPTPRHLYASCSGNDIPERAANDYIEKTFDEFSANFDVKMEKLAYQGPRLIREALAKAGRPAGNLVGLDAGCGTGLCGPLIKPYCSRLVGVDLSSGMLDAAARLGVYDELLKAELTEYLAANKSAFDVIVAADTLIYFGSLDEVLNNAREALKSGGLLIFTIEEGEGGEIHALTPTGRYSHGRDYVRRVLADTGFDVLAIDFGTVRFEFGHPVDCLVVSASAR